MNFEHLCKHIALNIHRVKSIKAIRRFLKYQYEALKIKKNKLKLGAVSFDLIDINYYEVTLMQKLEMRYIRQDTSADDELKIENRLKALNWKWDYANVLAFLIVFTLFLLLFMSCFYMWYCNNLPAFAYRNPKYDLLVERSFNLLFLSNYLSGLRFLFLSNFFFVDSILTVCSFFKVLF